MLCNLLRWKNTCINIGKESFKRKLFYLPLLSFPVGFFVYIDDSVKNTRFKTWYVHSYLSCLAINFPDFLN